MLDQARTKGLKNIKTALFQGFNSRTKSGWRKLHIELTLTKLFFLRQVMTQKLKGGVRACERKLYIKFTSIKEFLLRLLQKIKRSKLYSIALGLRKILY